MTLKGKRKALMGNPPVQIEKLRKPMDLFL